MHWGVGNMFHKLVFVVQAFRWEPLWISEGGFGRSAGASLSRRAHCQPISNLYLIEARGSENERTEAEREVVCFRHPYSCCGYVVFRHRPSSLTGSRGVGRGCHIMTRQSSDFFFYPPPFYPGRPAKRWTRRVLIAGRTSSAIMRVNETVCHWRRRDGTF